MWRQNGEKIQLIRQTHYTKMEIGDHFQSVIQNRNQRFQLISTDELPPPTLHFQKQKQEVDNLLGSFLAK